jgi:hypothetical protein
VHWPSPAHGMNTILVFKSKPRQPKLAGQCGCLAEPLTGGW